MYEIVEVKRRSWPMDEDGCTGKRERVGAPISRHRKLSRAVAALLKYRDPMAPFDLEIREDGDVVDWDED